jgi:hypothetical protein
MNRDGTSITLIPIHLSEICLRCFREYIAKWFGEADSHYHNGEWHEARTRSLQVTAAVQLVALYDSE